MPNPLPFGLLSIRKQRKSVIIEKEKLDYAFRSRTDLGVYNPDFML